MTYMHEVSLSDTCAEFVVAWVLCIIAKFIELRFNKDYIL